MTETAHNTNVASQTSRPRRIRWPLRLQLLLPMLFAVLLVDFLSTGITTYWIALSVRSQQAGDLDRVAKALTEAAFPLTEPVLTQMRRLSGAEFVLLNRQGHPQQATLSIDTFFLENLKQIAKSPGQKENGKKPLLFQAGRDYLLDYVTVSGRANITKAGTLFILYPEDQLASRIYQAVYPALMAGLVAAIAASAVATWLARRFARPIRKLVGQTTAIAQGDFTPMPTPTRNDELCDLIQSINSMTAQLADYEKQVRQHERAKTFGQLGAAMAHQLRNAATGGTMAIELHRRDCPNATRDEALDVAVRQLRLMETYLRQFLSLDAPALNVQELVNTTELVTDVLELLRPSYIHAGIELQFSPPGRPLFVRGDPGGLSQLATNLLLNAVEAAASNSAKQARVLIDISFVREGVGAISVQDTGPGPAESIRDQLFNSFVTTKQNGVGLGLYVSRQIAERHKGRIFWQRRDNLTTFVFEFPLAPDT